MAVALMMMMVAMVAATAPTVTTITWTLGWFKKSSQQRPVAMPQLPLPDLGLGSVACNVRSAPLPLPALEPRRSAKGVGVLPAVARSSRCAQRMLPDLVGVGSGLGERSPLIAQHSSCERELPVLGGEGSGFRKQPTRMTVLPLPPLPSGTRLSSLPLLGDQGATQAGVPRYAQHSGASHLPAVVDTPPKYVVPPCGQTPATSASRTHFLPSC